MLAVTRDQLIQLLHHVRFGNLIPPPDPGEDSEMDEDMNRFLRGHRRRRRPASTRPNYPPVPNPAGQELMRSGLFGTHPGPRDTEQHLSRSLLGRELESDRNGRIKTNRLISQALIPSSAADTIIHYDQRCYSGQFSDDGNFFFSCCQDFLVRMYDTSNPYDWKHYKSVEFMFPQWTITDATLSPDNKFLAYTSICEKVCLAATDPADTRDPQVLNFSTMGATAGRRARARGWGRFGVRLLALSPSMQD
jgi:DDB1- and CUL4-associated factor 11